jgi:hypothetical protein
VTTNAAHAMFADDLASSALGIELIEAADGPEVVAEFRGRSRVIEKASGR